MRCAKTVPTSVAQTPLRRGSLRTSTATRASSPIRPGSTAFAISPTENAEKIERKRGHGFGIAASITCVHANARATTESRLKPIATATHSQRTAVNASPTVCQFGPWKTSSAITPASPAITKPRRSHGFRRRLRP